MAKKKQDINRWFREAGYGMFIHWGIYSLLGKGEQVLFRDRLDPAEYAKLAWRFKPSRFDADEWARLAKDAGMKYATLTTKHHDGFCLFDSQVSNYTSVKTGAKRDFIAEYVKALRKHGLKVGLYYSLADWTKPAYFRGPKRNRKDFAAFIDYTHTQVRELMTNYGRIDVLWFDGGWPHDAGTWQSEKLDRMIRRYQPNIMINDRLHGGGGGNVRAVGNASRRVQGYYDTFEQRAVGGAEVQRPKEACRTSVDHWWGYHAGENTWKSPADVVNLISMSAFGGANLLLNVGPKPDGTFPAPFRKILRETGQWLKVNGEAIYGAEPGTIEVLTAGRTTVKGNRLFVHAPYWPGEEMWVYGLANRVRSARILGQRGRVRVRRDGMHHILTGLPRRAPDPSCTVVELTCVGKPRRDPSVIHLWEGDRDTSPLGDWAARHARAFDA